MLDSFLLGVDSLGVELSWLLCQGVVQGGVF